MAEPYIVIAAVDVKYKRVVSGLSCFVLLGTDGCAYSLGADESGALGLGEQVKSCLQPKAIQFAEEETQIRSISSWSHGCLAIDDQGGAWYWGAAFASDGDKPSEPIDTAAEPENSTEPKPEAEAETPTFYLPTRIVTDPQHPIKQAVVTDAGGFFWG